MSNISRHMSPTYWAVCRNMIPTGFVWQVPGCTPKGIHPSLPPTAQVWPTCIHDIYMLTDRDVDRLYLVIIRTGHSPMRVSGFEHFSCMWPLAFTSCLSATGLHRALGARAFGHLASWFSSTWSILLIQLRDFPVLLIFCPLSIEWGVYCAVLTNGRASAGASLRRSFLLLPWDPSLMAMATRAVRPLTLQTTGQIW